MARAWITDRWVKDHVVELPDGSSHRLTPTSAQLRKLVSIPDHFRTSRFGMGKRWMVVWREEGKAGVTQKKRSFATKNEAEEFAAELEDNIRSGRYIDPDGGRRYFEDVAEEWALSRQASKSSTRYMYSNDFRRYVLPKWGRKRIGDIRYEAVVEWVNELSAGTAPRDFAREQRARGLSPSTVKRIVDASFGSVIRYARKRKLIGENPLEDVEFPRKSSDTEDILILSHADIESLASAMSSRGEQISTMIRFLAYSGLRIGEAGALEIRDLDLKRKRVRVRQTWTKDEDGTDIIGPTKTWESRSVPLPSFLIDELSATIRGRPPRAQVFLDTHGEPLSYSWFYNRAWLPALADTGLTSVSPTPHDLRHHAASAAIAAGANPKLVQRMLGHKDASITMNIYAHLWEDDMDQIMDAVSVHRSDALSREHARAA